MSTVLSPRITRSHFLFSLVTVSAFVMFVYLAMSSVESYRGKVQSEISVVRDSMTTPEWNAVDDRTKRRYSEWVIQSGLYETIKEWFLPKPSGSEVVKSFSGKWNYQLVVNAQVFLFQIIYRLTMLEFWLWTLFPLVVAILVSGINAHRAKKYQLTGTRANIVRVYLKAVWLSVIGLVCYLVLPSMMGSLAPYAPAIAFLLFAIASAGIVSAFHKG